MDDEFRSSRYWLVVMYSGLFLRRVTYFSLRIELDFGFEVSVCIYSISQCNNRLDFDLWEFPFEFGLCV